MLGIVPRNTVSDCRRIRSTTRGGLKLMVCVAPVVGVRTKDEMLTVKDKIEGWAGRVSATMVRLMEPVPLPPPPPPAVGGNPLQEASTITLSTRMKNESLLGFIYAPRQPEMRYRTRTGNDKSPHLECNAPCGARRDGKLLMMLKY